MQIQIIRLRDCEHFVDWQDTINAAAIDLLESFAILDVVFPSDDIAVIKYALRERVRETVPENDSAERLKTDIINGVVAWHSIKARFLALGGGAAAFELTKSPAIGKKLRKKLSKLVR